MAFTWGAKKVKKEDPLSPKEMQERLIELRREVKHLEDTSYGVALFFEGLSLLHAGQDAILETYQKQFRELLQVDAETLTQAKLLLETAESDSDRALELRHFKAVPCRQHPNPMEMERRAVALVDAYGRLFGNRPRSQEFNEDEVFSLVEEAMSVFRPMEERPAAGA